MDRLAVFIGKLFVVGAILLLLNYLYRATFWNDDLRKHSEILADLQRVQDSADILYFGESSNITFREDDADKRSISEMTGDYFLGLNIRSVSHGAWHAAVYKTFMENIPEKLPVKTIVITMNLRSFSMPWMQSTLETPICKSLVLLEPFPPLLNRSLLSFKGYDHLTNKEREQLIEREFSQKPLKFPYPVKFATTAEWLMHIEKSQVAGSSQIHDTAGTQLTKQFIRFYAFQIDTISNPRIRDFDQIVRMAKKSGWNLIFNILPENVELAQKLAGKDLPFLMKQNRDLLYKRYTRLGVVVVDNLESVPDPCFIDRHWPSEHYSEMGRRIVAHKLSEALWQFHPEAFHDRDLDAWPVNFFTFCESQTESWDPGQSLVTDMAFSRRYSSKTGDGNTYSIALKKPLSQIPDAAKHDIKVEAMIFQRTVDPEVKLVISISGKDTKEYWQGIPLKCLSTACNKWTTITYVVTVPTEVWRGDELKVYFLNPSKNKVYIDDFWVKMH